MRKFVLSLMLVSSIALSAQLTDYHAHAITDSYRDQEAYRSHLLTPHFLN